METKTSAQHIAADPAICHGEPTFRSTRILVADVPEQVESSISYEVVLEVALRDRQAMRLPKACPQSHVRRPPLMRPDWFRR